jgi:hypothetical protein
VQTQSRSTPLTGSSIAATPFIPAKFELPLLDKDGDNYEIWSTALTLALQNHRLWPIINGSETTPDRSADPDAYDEWCLKDCEARLMILLAVKKVGQKCIQRA